MVLTRASKESKMPRAHRVTSVVAGPESSKRTAHTPLGSMGAGLRAMVWRGEFLMSKVYGRTA